MRRACRLPECAETWVVVENVNGGDHWETDLNFTCTVRTLLTRANGVQRFVCNGTLVRNGGPGDWLSTREPCDVSKASNGECVTTMVSQHCRWSLVRCREYVL